MTQIKLQPLDQSPLGPNADNYYPIITTLVPDNLNDENKVFVETFLIDAVSPPNKKGWKVSYDNPTDFDRRVLDSKNHPLVLFQTKGSRGELIWDHPVAPINTMEAAADPVRANIEFQKKYTIGYARHFKKIKDGLWHATYEITNERAKKFFLRAKDKNIKLFTSPYIVRPSAEKDRQNIRQWALIHNAIVSQPANPEDLAQVQEICAANGGDTSRCQSLFASLTLDDETECGFCVEQSLEDYQSWVVSSQDSKIEQIKNMPESASQAATVVSSPTNTTPAGTTTVETIQPTSTIQTTVPEVKSQQEQPRPDEKPHPQQTEPQSQNDEKDARIVALENQLKEMQQRSLLNERRFQVEKVIAPVQNHIYVDPNTGTFDEKAYNADVKKYTNSSHSLEELQELFEARYFKLQALAQAKKAPEKASVTPDSSQVTESASYFPYTQMSASSGNNQSNSKPVWLNVLSKTLGGFA